MSAEQARGLTPIAWQFRISREDGSWSPWEFWRHADKPEIVGLDGRMAEYRALFLGREDANKELPRVWRSLLVPGWPDPLSHYTEADALRHIRQFGDAQSFLTSHVPNYDYRRHTPEETRAMISAEGAGA